MFSKGADVDALRDSAGRMASFGREVDVVRVRGQRAVSTMQRVWQGPDLQHLVERWRRVEHDLTRIAAELDQLSRRLHDNADLQHRSSGASTSAGGSHHGGGAGSPSAAGHGAGHGAGQGGGRGGGHATGHAGGQGHVAAAWASADAQLVPGWGQHGGRPVVHGAEWSDALVGWGPDGGRPLVTPGVPQPLHAMGWGHWIGTPTAGAAFEPFEPTHGPVLPAAVAATAALGLGLPIR